MSTLTQPVFSKIFINKNNRVNVDIVIIHVFQFWLCFLTFTGDCQHLPYVHIGTVILLKIKRKMNFRREEGSFF